MTGGVLTLDFGRDDRRLKVAFFEGEERTLRPYEIHKPDWRQIEETCREILSAFNRSNRCAELNPDVPNELKKSGHLLFDLLLPSRAKEKLANTAAEILTLRLEDTLVHIPWELLYDGREFLCRRFAIGRIASTRQTPTARAIRAPAAPFRVLVLADPRGDLEAAYREGLDIKTFLDQRRDVFRVDFKSCPVDIAFIKKNLRDYDIVHYAGHAEYDRQDSSESGWLLSDGTLRTNDIAAMGGHQPMPALVFSNACQSGQSEEWSVDDQGQRIFGLANAFLLSGVQHYIGTFREIVDEPSAQFAQRVYALIAEGEAIGTALCKARRASIDRGREETLVWANYMLYGDPSRQYGVIAETSTKAFPPRFFGQWNRILPAGTIAAKTRNSGLAFPLICAVLLTVLYVAYSRFYLDGPSQSAIAARQPGTQSTIAPAAIPSPPIAAPLSLSMNIIGQRKEPDGGYTEVIVREGSVLQSRDHFQVHVETNKRSHIYVLLFDSQGHAAQLFPDPKIEQPGFFDSGRRIAVPDKDLWFWLDENPGTETVYVLASEEPLNDIRGLLSKMNEASETERKRLSGEIRQRIGIVERGVGGVAKGKTVSYALSDGRTIQKVTEVVAGSGVVVRAISFEHR